VTVTSQGHEEGVDGDGKARERTLKRTRLFSTTTLRYARDEAVLSLVVKEYIDGEKKLGRLSLSLSLSLLW